MEGIAQPNNVEFPSQKPPELMTDILDGATRCHSHDSLHSCSPSATAHVGFAGSSQSQPPTPFSKIPESISDPDDPIAAMKRYAAREDAMRQSMLRRTHSRVQANIMSTSSTLNKDKTAAIMDYGGASASTSAILVPFESASERAIALQETAVPRTTTVGSSTTLSRALDYSPRAAAHHIVDLDSGGNESTHQHSPRDPFRHTTATAICPLSRNFDVASRGSAAAPPPPPPPLPPSTAAN
jgi:hypothetical protein